MLTWQEYTRLSEEELAQHDIADLNLACAAGLPGSEKIDLEKCHFFLDWWSRRVQQETRFQLPKFRRRRYDFKNSEAYFRILVMITVLQRDLGVRYNPAKIPEDTEFDTADCFIHGILQGRGGTCVTMPVVYVAVGRRLGYPLKLVAACGKRYIHGFARWDEQGGERLNIEATAQGLSCHPDDYYRTGRYALAPEVERDGCYLKSKAPREELAMFLNERGWRWEDFENHRNAVEAFAWSCSLTPQNKLQFATLKGAIKRWQMEILRISPPNLPPIRIDYHPPRRFPDSLPEGTEKEILRLGAMDNILKDPHNERKWWQPLRHKLPLDIELTGIHVAFATEGYGVNFSFRKASYKPYWSL